MRIDLIRVKVSQQDLLKTNAELDFSGLAAPSSFSNSKPPASHGSNQPSLSRPSSTTPANPQHPSPLPPSAGNGNHSVPSTSNAPLARAEHGSPAIGNSQSQSSAVPSAMAKEGSKESEKQAEFDPENVTRDLKKEGSDWMTMYNPNVKRVLDVGLVHTLVHDSCVSF